jgi:surface protein
MGVSDRKRSIDVSVNINLDFNEEIRPNNFIVENNFKSGNFVSRKKSGNILAGSKLNVDGQGIFNVKNAPLDIIKHLPKYVPESGNPPIPIPIPIPPLPPACDFTGSVIIAPRPFISIWRTTSPFESITLPYDVSGTYNGTIDWGDGNISGNSYSNQTHTYDDYGDYTITIIGTIIGFNFGVYYSDDSNTKIIEILQWGSLNLGNDGSYFNYCENLILTGVTDTLNLVGTTNLSSIFYNCLSLTTINNINDWNVSNVENMSTMFAGLQFNQDINSWDVSNVMSMSQMFSNSSFNQPINNWIVSGVTDMSGMFEYTSFDHPLSGWNVSGVINMSGMFAGTLFNHPLSGWNVSNVENMSTMFAGSQFNLDINSWNVSGVTDMSYMFQGSQFDKDISLWNVSNVVGMSWMFQNSQFTQPLSNWERISPDISTLSNVRDMSWMFATSSFNQPIGNWNVSGVTDMSLMFVQNINFNHPLSGWNVSSVIDMSWMFGQSSFNQPIGDWNVSGVTNMSQMFSECPFNHPLSGWNVSSVIYMNSMFFDSSFNQPISSWTVSNVVDMGGMFRRSQFNQNIGNWNISGVTNFSLFMGQKSPLTFSTTNLNAIYNGWSTKNPKPNLNINFGGAKYTLAGQSGKNILTGSTMSGGYGWTIIDGGIL